MDNTTLMEQLEEVPECDDIAVVAPTPSWVSKKS